MAATPDTHTVPTFPATDLLFRMVMHPPFRARKCLEDACRGLVRVDSPHSAMDLGPALSKLADAVTPHVPLLFETLAWPEGTTARVAEIPNDPHKMQVLVADVPGSLPVVVRYNGRHEHAPNELVDIPVSCQIDGYYSEAHRRGGIHLIATLIPAPLHRTPPERVGDAESLALAFPRLCESARKPHRFDLGFYA